MSGQAGSGTVTAGFLEWAIPPLSPLFEPVHFVIRKTIHLTAYGLLGYLDFRAVRGPRRGWMVRWSVIAVVLAVMVASLDEWHQSFVPGRTSMAGDVGIDAIGATFAQLFAKIADRRSLIADR